MAGIELPVPTGKGSTIAWEVGEAGVTSFTYATVSEDLETAAGEERTGKVTFTGTITRADLEATQQARVGAYSARMPDFNAVHTALDLPGMPILLDQLPPLLMASGEDALTVIYHEEEDPKKAKTSTMKAKDRFVGIWEVIDVGNLMAALLNDGDGPPLEYLGQDGSLAPAASRSSVT
jgi:hypothetical protein